MPKRTNDFQELVVLVQKALAPEGATVTESALVETGTEGETREIDALIDTKVGEYRIRIAVEAKDEARPMDITRFESIVGKYLVEGGVRTNKIAIVTHNGFTKSVMDRAKKLDIDLFTLQEAKQFDWSQFKPPGPSFKCFLEIKDVRLEPDLGLKGDAFERAQIICSCGKNRGTPLDFAKQNFWQFAVQKCADQLIAADNEAFAKKEEKKCSIRIADFNENHIPSLLFGSRSEALKAIQFDVVFRTSPEAKHIYGEQFSFASYICRVEVVPPPPELDVITFTKGARLICECCGKDHGSVVGLVTANTAELMKPTSDAQKSLREAVSKSPNGIAHLLLAVGLNDRMRVVSGGVRHKATEIRIHVHGEKGDPMKIRQFEFKNVDGDLKRVCQFHANVAGKSMKILMPDGIHSKKIVLKFDDAIKKDTV